MSRKLGLAGLLLGFVAGSYPAAPYDSSISPALTPLEISANRGAAALWQTLKKLRTRASLLMITAHPDDEDGGMLAFESRGFGARVALLTLNRGEGGANVMSSDFWDALGLVRTQELLAAGRYYGVDQYWTSVCDYGFSKTLDEAVAKWSDTRVLGDAVRVVRTVRPLVVVSVFVGGESDGHGNHQMAGRVTKEVFEAAGDPNQFPDQIRQGLRPWKPLKYYAMVPVFGENKAGIAETVSIPEGAYDPVLGSSYLQLSDEGLGLQKSQNGGPFIPRAGKVDAPYHRFASRVVSTDHEQSFFDGIDVTLRGIASVAPENERAFLSQSLQRIESHVAEATAAFRMEHPEGCTPYLAEGLRTTDALIEKTKTSGLSETTRDEILHELEIKRTQFNNALLEALGISIRATVRSDKEVNPLFALFMGDPDTFRMAIPGQHFGVQVSVTEQASLPVTLERISLDSPQPDGFSIHADKSRSNRRLLENKSVEQTFGVDIAERADFTRPYFTRPSIEQPYYYIQKGSDPNRSLAPYPLNAWVEIKYDGLTLKTGQVVQTIHRETGPGVVYEPLTVGPAVSIQVSPNAGIIPLDAKSFPLSVTIHSNVKGPAKGSVKLSLPPGWKSDPPLAVFQTSQDGENQALSFHVEPAGLKNAAYTINAIANYAGRDYREGYAIAGYPGLRPYFLYRGSEYKATGTDVAVAPNLKIGYVTGSGDDVPATLGELGLGMSFLTARDVAGANLSQYDVILLGVRAYAARPELAIYNTRLLDYVKNGGVLIVQYNTPEFDHNFGPYPYTMGNEPEEVVDEASDVQILDPANPLFNWPNKITKADFHGWVEERGSKFLTSWDKRYSALLETHDPGQAPQKGGLLFARYGKGAYIYNAYAFYRELPEGVPGAFRLMANMLSLPRNPQR